MDDFDEFVGAAPAPLAAGGLSSYLEMQSSVANLQPLPADLFGAQAEGDEWGDFAVSSNGTFVAQQLRHQPTPPAAVAAATPAVAPRLAPAGAGGPVRRGAAAWYLDGRTRQWVEAKVLSVNETTKPPSYCVELHNSGTCRVTELHRLRLCQPGTLPPAATDAAGRATAHSAAAPVQPPTPAVAAFAAIPAHITVNGHVMQQAAAADIDNWGDNFGDFAAAPAPLALAFAPTSTAAAAAAAAAPSSPFMVLASPGTAAPPAAAAPISPWRTPARCLSTGSSSPAVERFRSFLHVAAPDVADLLQEEERQHEATVQQQEVAAQQQQQQQQQQQDDEFDAFKAGPPVPAAAPSQQQQQQQQQDDEFGDFKAGPPVPAAAPSQQQPSPPAGVQRNAPLPLDLFGDEPLEDAPLYFATAAAAGTWTVLPPQQQQQHQAPPTVLQHHQPGMFTDPAGRVLTVNYADWFVPLLPAQAAAGMTAAAVVCGMGRAALTAAARVGGWDNDDGFGDFVGVEADPQPALHPHAVLPAIGLAASPASTEESSVAPLPPPLPAGVLQGTPLPLDLVGNEPLEDAPLDFATTAAAADVSAADRSAAAEAGTGEQEEENWEAQATGQPTQPQHDQQYHLPSKFTDPTGRALEGNHAIIFMQMMPEETAAVDGAAVAAANDPAIEASAAGAAPATMVKSWTWEEEDAKFDDLMGAEAEAQPGLEQQPEGQLRQELSGAVGEAASLESGKQGSSSLALEDTAEALDAQGAAPAESFALAGGLTGFAAASATVTAQLQQSASPRAGGGADGGRSQASTVLSALQPVSLRSSLLGSSKPATSASTAALASKQFGWAAATPALVPTGGSAAAGMGDEVVTEYAVAWARLMQAAVHLLQATVTVWAEASNAGSWQRQQERPEVQQHMAACGQLYCVAAIVRLAAQQLGLLSLVPELQEAWAQAEAAWQSLPPAAAVGGEDGNEQLKERQEGGEEEQQQPPFREMVLAASQAWAVAAADDAGGCGFTDAQTMLGLVEGAPQKLEVMSLDDFPRLLEWSEGLCGLSLLPLSLFKGHLPVEPWAGGRACLVPLANLWLHRISHTPPHLD